MFWVISVYFNIRNTLPKFCPFLLGHPVHIYIYRVYIYVYRLRHPCSRHTRVPDSIPALEFVETCYKYLSMSKSINSACFLSCLLSFFLSFLVWRLLPTVVSVKGWLSHLITLNHTHTHTHTFLYFLFSCFYVQTFSYFFYSSFPFALSSCICPPWFTFFFFPFFPGILLHSFSFHSFLHWHTQCGFSGPGIGPSQRPQSEQHTTLQHTDINP